MQPDRFDPFWWVIAYESDCDRHRPAHSVLCVAQISRDFLNQVVFNQQQLANEPAEMINSDDI